MSAESKEKVFIDVKEFADRSGLPLKLITKLIDDNRLPCVLVGANQKRLIHVDQLKRLEMILRGSREVVMKGATA